MASTKPNRVWIEVEMPGGVPGLGVARAAAYTALLRKLGDDTGAVSWNARRCCYEYYESPRAVSYFLPEDEPGFWFNLDFFAASPAEQEAYNG